MKKCAFLLVLCGCDAIAADDALLDAFACSVLPYYAADCLDPAVKARVSSVLTDGAVEAQIECLGIAIGAGGKVASVYYQASKLQDGSCFATANVTGPAPSGGGFAQSSGSKLTRRSDAAAGRCPVTSWHVPQLRTTTTVEAGVVRVEGPFCTTSPGTVCSMAVATSCTGDVGSF